MWDEADKRPVETLSENDRQLSIAEVVSDTLLRERLEQGWLPADEVQPQVRRRRGMLAG